MARGRASIGTSGWSYRHWRGPFYPVGLPAKQHLAFYAERFDTVEVNGTFYRLIAPQTLSGWREQTPGNFVFACKGSRFLTHMKRLTDCGQGLERYFERVRALGPKLGPILFQLPETFRPQPERLAGSSTACPAATATPSSSATPTGSGRKSSNFCAAGMRLCASTTSPAGTRRSRSPPTSFTSACTGRAVPTRAPTASRR